MRRKPHPLLAIFLIVLVDILGFTLILPLLPFYAERFGGSPIVYGFLVTAYAICQLFSGPFLGRLSDTMGRKPLLLVSQIGTCLGFLLLGRATALWMVFLSRIIDGATAGNLSLAQAYIADVTEPENRSKAFGLIGISFGIGFLIGPTFSGYLATYGYQYPPYAAAFLSFLSILGTLFLLPTVEKAPEVANIAASQTSGAPDETERRKSIFEWKAYSVFFKNPELSRLFMKFFCFGFAFSLYISGLALFAERRFTLNGMPFGPREVGYLMGFSGFLGLIIQGGLLGRLVKKLGETQLVAAGFISMAMGFGSVSIIHQAIPYLLIAMIFSSFGTGVLRPVLTSLITQKAGKKDQGLILGLTQTLMSIAQIFAPLLSGLILESSHLAIWALVAGSMGIIGILI